MGFAIARTSLLTESCLIRLTLYSSLNIIVFVPLPILPRSLPMPEKVSPHPLSITAQQATKRLSAIILFISTPHFHVV